ncbi:MAG: alpha-hydroxy-acid oxidizing protein [Anaerolineae bacterium]|nr:alpha-hydroxy-acid oxidizing protein [Anaerolineae bacterium]
MPDLHYLNDVPLHSEDRRERDACALICAVRKGGQATHGNVKRTIEALTRMNHRTGFVDGEGDGVGIMTDIPRELWAKTLAHNNIRSSLVTTPRFWVAHLMIPNARRAESDYLIAQIDERIRRAGLDVLIQRAGRVESYILGRSAQANEPLFVQFAGTNEGMSLDQLERTIYQLQKSIETEFKVHFPSFSSRSVVYKVQGTIEILRRYYPELRDPDYASTVTLGHARYSTNTNPIFERAQPFNVLGHNGEFNTISRFRLEAQMLGIALPENGSDSQDVDAVVDALCMNYGLDLIEAMEHVFPPFRHDLIQSSSEIHSTYEAMRRSFGPFAQGPAAVVARVGDQVVLSVDALGLRPLWYGETEKEYFASSERGVYPLDNMSVDSKPLAPGEKIALVIRPGQHVEVLDYPAIQRHVTRRRQERAWSDDQPNPSVWSTSEVAYRPTPSGSGHGARAAAEAVASPAAVAEADFAPEPEPLRQAEPRPWQAVPHSLNTQSMAALGWERYHLSVIETMAETRKEQVGSLGWDGPLAALSKTRVNLADYFKETVAVVTNPAIDRERERAQFSTEVLLGSRPALGSAVPASAPFVSLRVPLVFGGHPDLGSLELHRELARKHGTMILDDLVDQFGDAVAFLSMSAGSDETLDSAVERLKAQAVELARAGARCIILDDSEAYAGDTLWIDPLLGTAAVDRALREADDSPNLRRQVGVIVRSGALRDMHDLVLCLGMGANALVPYAIYAVALGIAPRAPREPLAPETAAKLLDSAVSAITIAIQKIISTIGCHELRGYGHSFSSIGLTTGIANLIGAPNYFGSDERGLTWSAVTRDAQQRAREFRGEDKSRLDNPDRLYPKMWKKIEDIAHGELSRRDYEESMLKLESEMPVAPRHIIGLKESEANIHPASVDIRVGKHSMPVLIGAMSFGSQGELAYKAYAEAAARMEILCVNGEGGELPDIMGKYKPYRGNQIASARFGVNIEFLNSCSVLEIKIGQGAKPGEGGQLPGYKVTPKVAEARHTAVGVDLISPSNNHDLYSIEDLAQLIDELKIANPKARVSVKIPVVPGVGIIAVGVAKAGADIINITGYEGGTGAARAHSLRHVGLPAEIGVWLAHHALIASGLRQNVELWCDGGMKSGRDVIKMLCLGANRVGFGTLAMVAVGCTICRKCHEGTCHVGITTHLTTVEEALEAGVKHFEPRDFDAAVQGICNVFTMLGEDIQCWTARLGFTRTQDLVGRADLLEQIDLHDQIDLSPLFHYNPIPARAPLQNGVGRLVSRPRNFLTKQITGLVERSAEFGDEEMTYDDEQVMAMDRALGTHTSGAMERGEIAAPPLVHLRFSNSAVPGNGLGAFIDDRMDILVEGGAQDGVAKCSRGGIVAILKGLNHNGTRLDGSVGKSFAYGAQAGRFIVQGNADSRACIRLSGADVVFGGEIKSPLRDELGGIGARANLKGFACEYMTSGRVVILGDPGPWMCAGMSGGVVYQRVQPEMGLTEAAIKRRIAEGAMVDIFPLDQQGLQDVKALLQHYIDTLCANNQSEAAKRIAALRDAPSQHFVMLAPPSRYKRLN